MPNVTFTFDCTDRPIGFYADLEFDCMVSGLETSQPVSPGNQQVVWAGPGSTPSPRLQFLAAHSLAWCLTPAPWHNADCSGTTAPLAPPAGGALHTAHCRIRCVGADHQAQQDSHTDIHQLYPVPMNRTNSHHINNEKAMNFAWS